MKKHYEKPSADWISFQIDEDLARGLTAGGSVGDISGGVGDRVADSNYQNNGAY